MKILILILIFCPFFAIAQTTDTKSSISKGNPHPLYIIDGKKIRSDEDLGITQADIADLTVYKDEQATRMFGEDGKNGVMLIFTKKYYTKIYMGKFSELSIQYKNYLIAHDNDDKRVTYVVNGQKVEGFKSLYYITREPIDQIVFNTDSRTGKVTAVITTKK